MTRVAWVTHHLTGERSGSALLPGQYAGGAEMVDADMVAAAPDGVEVVWVPPDRWEEALDADRVVITGTDLLSDVAMVRLADEAPVVWVHHQQDPSPARAYLLRKAFPFVGMSDLHVRAEEGWAGVLGEVCSGWIDVSGIEQGPKGGHALWAARNHPQKGLLSARFWAAREGVELRELTDVPRDQVLAGMAEARWFVFLPTRLDACPRTLIEAEAAGCDIVTNGNAGRRPPGPLAEVMWVQRERFWGWV